MTTSDSEPIPLVLLFNLPGIHFLRNKDIFRSESYISMSVVIILHRKILGNAFYLDC